MAVRVCGNCGAESKDPLNKFCTKCGGALPAVGDKTISGTKKLQDRLVPEHPQVSLDKPKNFFSTLFAGGKEKKPKPQKEAIKPLVKKVQGKGKKPIKKKK